MGEPVDDPLPRFHWSLLLDPLDSTRTAPTGSHGNPLVLSGVRPVAEGLKRLIFQHPGHPDQLIKILRTELVQRRFGPTGSFHNRHRRCRQYNHILREMREYLVACARSEASLVFLPEIVGLVHTDLGLGLVVKRVPGPEGGLAPTLGTIAMSGRLDQKRLALLQELEEAIVASDIVIDDLHPNNVVLNRDASGAERFILIDGLGCSTAIPLKAFARHFNRRSKRKAFRKLWEVLAGMGPKAHSSNSSTDGGTGPVVNAA